MKYDCHVIDREAMSVEALRIAVFKRDGSIVNVVRGRLTEDVLQLAGDGLLDAITEHEEGAVEIAAQCAAALLRSLPVDLDEALAVARRLGALLPTVQ